MRPSTQYCILILQERISDLEQSGWGQVLAEHPERKKIIEHEQRLNDTRIEMLKDGIRVLQTVEL